MRAYRGINIRSQISHSVVRRMRIVTGSRAHDILDNDRDAIVATLRGARPIVSQVTFSETAN
jgi:hypothetical protein